MLYKHASHRRRSLVGSRTPELEYWEIQGGSPRTMGTRSCENSIAAPVISIPSGDDQKIDRSLRHSWSFQTRLSRLSRIGSRQECPDESNCRHVSPADKQLVHNVQQSTKFFLYIYLLDRLPPKRGGGLSAKATPVVLLFRKRRYLSRLSSVSNQVSNTPQGCQTSLDCNVATLGRFALR